jgi:multidrug efflux pump
MIVFLVTLAWTAILYLAIPKGFFPQQIPGSSRASPRARSRRRFGAMTERSRNLARILLEDPAVASVSTFIGVAGTNFTQNCAGAC